MTTVTFINRTGSDCKRVAKKIGGSLENATKDLDKANEHLIDAKYQSNSSARSTIGTLKKYNTHEKDDFYAFADTLELFVNKLIDTDKERAKSIRASGKTHRQKNGLPRSLIAATINASFNKMKDIVVDAALDLANWAVDAVDWVCDRVEDIGEWIWENKEFLLQMASGTIQILSAIALVVGASASGLLGLGVIITAGVNGVLGFDKIAGGILNYGEGDMNGWSQTIIDNLVDKGKLPKWLSYTYKGIYTLVDLFFGTKACKNLGEISFELDYKQKYNKTRIFFDSIKEDKNISSAIEYISKVSKAKNPIDIISELNDYYNCFTEGPDKGFEKGFNLGISTLFNIVL